MPTKAKSIPAPLSEDAVRDRAYLMWEADGRPEGKADYYWMKASEPAPDVSAKPKAKAAKTAAALKSVKPKGKAVSPVEATPTKTRAVAKTATKAADKPKLKAAAAKVSAPAVKAKPAAKAPAKKKT